MIDIRSELFLRQWKMLEKNVNILTDYERKSGRLLFNSLKEISADSRQVLKEKYYDSNKYAKYDKDRKVHTTVMPIKDDVLALNRGLLLEDYRLLKNNAQLELEYKLDDVSQKIIQQERFVFVELKGLYVLDIGETDWFSFFSNNIVLNSDMSLAYKFDTENMNERKIVEIFENHGFKRKLLDRDW